MVDPKISVNLIFLILFQLHQEATGAIRKKEIEIDI